MEGYSVTIRESSKELEARERLKLKDLTNSTKLDDVCGTGAEGAITVTPVDYAILDIHNERSENKDYTVYVIIDDAGTKYHTGSESFFTSFMEIYREMQGEGDFMIEVYKKDSKNRAGKQFITCSIV